jgi:hypothetical protein
MPVYVIFIRERTLDQPALDVYALMAPLSLDGWPRLCHGNGSASRFTG